MPTELKCKNCFQKFSVSKNRAESAKFCSRQCAFQYKVNNTEKERVSRECKVCKIQFEVVPSVVKKGAGRFCSRACYAQWLSQNQVGENHPMWAGGGIEKICETCSKSFFVKKAVDKKGHSRFCSKKCAAEAQRKVTGENHPSWKGKIKLICAICEKEFERHNSAVQKGEGTCCSKKCLGEYRSKFLTGPKAANYKNRTITGQCKQCNKDITIRLFRAEKGRDKFCGRKCFHDWYSQNLSGENSAGWLGGDREYPQEWEMGIKKIIRARDEFRCKICGVSENSMPRVLDVHHIDYDKHNLSPANLISLCRSCHAKTNSNREYWKVFLNTMNKLYAVLDNY